MKLYPYQDEGVRFLLARRRAYLADEMGLGKTAQAIVAAHMLPGADRFTYAVVCPASLRENWRREWMMWRGPAWRTEPVIHSYTHMGMHGWRENKLPDVLILDEAHYCKTPTANRTRATMRLAAAVRRHGGYVWCLSGTPTPNDPTELWPVLKTLWPALLESWGITRKEQFMHRFCQYTMGDYGPKIWGLKPEAKTVLAPALKSIMLRRKLADVALDLPPLRFTSQALAARPDIEKQIRELAAPTDDPDMLATTRRLLGEIKAPAIARVIGDELRDNPETAIVVMHHHIGTGRVLHRELHEYGVVGFDGSTAHPARQAAIDAFQAGQARVFLAQQTAAGVGITLTRASEIVLAEPSWSPADNVQAIKRIHRIGQDKPCRARIFYQPGTMDEGLMDTLLRKSKMIKETLE